jgi:hypothetical protein
MSLSLAWIYVVCVCMLGAVSAGLMSWKRVDLRCSMRFADML